MNLVMTQTLPTSRRTNLTGTVMAPLSKWCKKAIPQLMMRSTKIKSTKVDDNDWSFKDKTLPWNEVSVITLWDEKAELDITVGEASDETDVEIWMQGGLLPEWKEADIIDSAWFEDASFYSDEASFYAQDDSSRYSQDDDDDECDALEEYLRSFFNEISRSTYDDASYCPDGNDESRYFNGYSRYEINFDDDASEDEVVVVSPAMFDDEF